MGQQGEIGICVLYAEFSAYILTSLSRGQRNLSLSSDPNGLWGEGWGLWVMQFAMLVGTCGLAISSQAPGMVKNAWESLTIDSDLGLA